ncbi:MAG: beta-ketoacyl synthase N-terminal-like domain-containing protein [Pseudomonadota bacterium]
MEKDKSSQMPVAVVGMHGRFPDAYDPAEFWSNLIGGHDAFRQIPETRWSWQDYFGPAKEDGMQCSVNCAAFMPDIDKFDHRSFGIMPREAESMDPQQRLFMQTAYLALEDAGVAPSSLVGSRTGVFVGVGNAEYHTMMVRENARFDLFRGTGLALTSVANRVSFHLDIRGPSETLDTACSGSLVAIHRAIQSMSTGECERAIVGGVNLLIGPDLFVAFDKAGMLSHDARSKTFDAEANGYARGEGVAALVLCPLEKAEANGDHIYAVIHGSAENHGGRAHSFTAPNAKSQADVVKRAWDKSGQDFFEAACLETHGTGTPLGDPIEVKGLQEAASYFSEKATTEQNKTIALGALKSHIGHMEATAGIGGIIKMILSFKHRMLPANLHFKTLNPHIDLNDSPFYVPTSNTALDEDNEQIAGISSFGFGGVNAHVVLGSYQNEKQNVDSQQEQQQEQQANQQLDKPYLVVLSGRDKESLLARVTQMHDFLFSEEIYVEQDVFAILDAVCSERAVSEVTISLNTPLHTLIETQYQLYKLKRDIDNLFSVNLKDEDIAGCYSVADLIHTISRVYQSQLRCKKNGVSFIQPQVCLPVEEQQRVTLAQIAYSLQDGRDYLKHRLACVVTSKAQLTEVLGNYLNNQDEQQENFWVNALTNKSSNNKSAKVEQPNAEPDKRSDIAELTTWANWWLHTKTASLDWETIYQNEQRPNKTPLPASPFRRTRIWYSAQATQEIPNKNKISAAHNDNAIAGPQTHSKEAPVVLDGNLFKAWKQIQNNTLTPLSSSVLATGLILDYAIYKSSGTTTKLHNIVFGKPKDIGRDVRFSEHPSISSNKNKTSSIYCLSGLNPKAVIVRAELVDDSNIQKPKTNTLGKIQTNLTTEEYIKQLKKNAYLSASLDNWVRGVQVYDAAFSCQIDIGLWNERSSQFWVPLLHCISASFAYLFPQKNTPAVFVSEIKDCVIDAPNAAEIKSYLIQYDVSTMSFSIDFKDRNNQSRMTWSGVKLRRFSSKSGDDSNATADFSLPSESGVSK